ncbi:MAG: hypothetical protein ACKD6O_08080, partial [Candidatus Bathyarchaeota archaeon]
YIDAARLEVKRNIRNWWTVESWIGNTVAFSYHFVEKWTGSIFGKMWSLVEKWVSQVPSYSNLIAYSIGSIGFLCVALSIPVLAYGLRERRRLTCLAGLTIFILALILLFIFSMWLLETVI